jgi:hypothetical protein
VSKLTVSLSLLVLATFPFALGCSSATCVPIPDGVYTVLSPDGGPLFTTALVVPAPGDATVSDAAPRDGAPPDADPRDAAARDAATGSDAGRDAATAHDAAATHDAATAQDAAIAHDAAATVDAGTTRDAGTTTVAGTYAFHGGLPAPYDTWDCTKSAITCEMTYVCSQPGEQTVSIVTSYATGPHPTLAFSVTPPGTIVRLQPPPQ